MKTWTEISLHVLDMKQDAPTNVVACQLFNTVRATAPEPSALIDALQKEMAQFEIEKRHYASDASFVAECDAKIAGCKELLAWIEE